MTVASVSFIINTPPERVFALSKDLEALGALIPDVTKVEVADEKNADWHLTTKLGIVKHTTILHTTITKMERPRHADFTGDSDELILSGSVDLTPLPDGGTNVSCVLEAHGKGPLRRIIDSMLETRLEKEANGFAQNLQKMLHRG
jgi:carbon monoxide dehydrogenase subunit G